MSGPATPTAPGSTTGIRRLSRAAGRVGWGFADQAVSSLGNFLLGFLVARAVDTPTFGAFSIAYTTYVVVVGVVRGAIAQPLMVRYSGTDEAAWRAAASRAGGLAWTIGLLAGAVCLAVGLLAGGIVGQGLIAVGISLPGLLVQDTCRYALFTHERGRSAFINDLFWVLIQAPALVVALGLGHDQVATSLLAWGGAGTAAALLGGRQIGVGLAPRQSLAWLAEHRVLVPRYVAEALASLTSSQLALYGVGAAAGLSTLGELRVGQLLIGPVLVIFIGLQLVAVPMAVRALSVSVDHLRRLCLAIGIATATFAAAWGLILSLVPDGLGRALLASNWEAAHGMVLLLALGLAASSLSSGALIGLRALASASRSLRATVIASTLTTALTIGGAAAFGAMGAAAGILVAHALAVPMWWWEFLRAGTAQERAGGVPGERRIAPGPIAEVDDP